MSYESAFFKNLVGGALPKLPEPGFVSSVSTHTLGISEKPTIVALNKIDRLQQNGVPIDIDQFEHMPTDFIFTSALKGIGFEELLLKLDYML